MHALQFTGAEVQPALYGSAIALEQGGGGSGIWSSHPSAIGYRRQVCTTGGSHGGSGSMTITIAAVAPEFDSGMNAGTGQETCQDSRCTIPLFALGRTITGPCFAGIDVRLEEGPNRRFVPTGSDGIPPRRRAGRACAIRDDRQTAPSPCRWGTRRFDCCLDADQPRFKVS